MYRQPTYKYKIGAKSDLNFYYGHCNSALEIHLWCHCTEQQKNSWCTILQGSAVAQTVLGGLTGESNNYINSTNYNVY